MERFFGELEIQLSEKIGERVMQHRNRFVRIFKGRYLELLPSLIHYENSEHLGIDFIRVEIALRQGYQVAIGENTLGNIQVLGYMKKVDGENNPKNFFIQRIRNENDIEFIIPKHLQQEKYLEISNTNNGISGNFFVLRNKNLQYVNEYEIIHHYIAKLAEIDTSRFSLAIQSKVSTFFISEHGDETVNQLVSDIYNGSPIAKVTHLFDPEEQIVTIDNANLASNFVELKREYQNVLAELNAMLGMNTLGVDKSSGVSEIEANSNKAYSTGNANIHLDGRNHGLRLANKRWGFELEAIYNDEVASELTRLSQLNEMSEYGGEGAMIYENNDNNLRDNSK